MKIRVDGQFRRNSRTSLCAGIGMLCLMVAGCLHGRLAGGRSCENASCQVCTEERCSPLCCFSGEEYSRCFDETVATKEAIHRANRSLRQCYAAPMPFDFKDGYRHAFVDIATGGDGVVPAVPPQRYWATCYRTAAGRQRAQDWYAGFVAGANQASIHCRYRENEVATSGIARLHLDESETGPSGPIWHDPDWTGTSPPPTMSPSPQW